MHMPRVVRAVTLAATVLPLVAIEDIPKVILATSILRDMMGSILQHMLDILGASTTGSEQDHTARLTSLTTILAPELITVVILPARVGLGILFQNQIESDLKSGDLKVIRVPKLDLDVGSFIIYRRDRGLSATAREFLSLLRQWRHKSRQISDTLRVA